MAFKQKQKCPLQNSCFQAPLAPCIIHEAKNEKYYHSQLFFPFCTNYRVELDLHPSFIIMSSRKRMSVLTSHSEPQIPAVPATPASPTGNPPVRYRVEERTRTIYVTSDVPPVQWDARNLGSLFPQCGNDQDAALEPVRRTRSRLQTQYIITEEAESSSRSQPRSAPAVLSIQGQHSCHSDPPSPLVSSPNHLFKGPRSRILFYHRQDPHYGFTNFSPHNVRYNGKVYPTSEHLFQSFKVRLSRLVCTSSDSLLQFQGYRDDLAEHIRLCSPFPSVAFSEARRFPDHIRPDWRRVNIRMVWRGDNKPFYS